MFYVEQHYTTLNKDRLFKTQEEALVSAEERASKDYEGYAFYVMELKNAVKAERPKFPVKTAVLEGNNILALLESDDDEDDSEILSIPD